MQAETPPLAIEIADRLAALTGVACVALGGSYARGTQHTGSDIDLGVYYRQKRPISITALRTLVAEISDAPDPVVTDFGRWGPWVNGGAWLTVWGQRVDFLYRNLDLIEAVIGECTQGQFASDYYQQVPYGFHSYIYLGELNVCVPLNDPDHLLAVLKGRINVYPEPLRASIVNRFLWGIEFALSQAKTFAHRGDAYNTIGCLTRAAAALVQVLYAVNRRYFVHDKGALDEIRHFQLQPRQFSRRLADSLMPEGFDHLTGSVRDLEELSADVARLCEGLYSRPDFRA